MKLDELKDNGPQDYKIFCDVDGVLADFEGGIKELTGHKLEMDKYFADKKYRNDMWKAVTGYSKRGGEFWFELKLLPDAMKLWNYIKPYDPDILTATGTSDASAGEQKRRWIEKYFGSDAVVHTTPHGRDKYKFAGKNHILIDDQEKSIGPWIEAGGIGILHTSAAKTIAELKKLGL